jgi:hypothetical protein
VRNDPNYVPALRSRHPAGRFHTLLYVLKGPGTDSL